jgi:phosphate transport system protein
MRVSFDQQLDEAAANLQEEGEVVLRALRGCLVAMERQDVGLADEVIAFDDEVDRRYVAIEQGIESLLALQAPVAGDLRRVMAMLHINLHLERIGDYCVTIAKLVKLTEGLGGNAAMLEAFGEMGVRAEEMIGVAISAFDTADAEKAASLMELDELIDRVNRRAVGYVMDLGSDPELREWGLRMILISRCLERIGDHAVDIGEQVAYMVTGEHREFTDASHPRTP